jgi:solute carrier family 25 2-oxodicarboxylate transporter 21
MALFKGLEATMWRHAIWNGAYFGLIFKVKELMPKAKVILFIYF